MGVAAPRAPVGGRVRNPPKSSVTGPSLLVNCYLKIKFYKKIPLKMVTNIYCIYISSRFIIYSKMYYFYFITRFQ